MNDRPFSQMIAISVSLLWSSTSLSMPLSPEFFRSIDAGVREDLEGLVHTFFFGLIVSSIVVAVGVALEGPELVHEAAAILRRCFGTKRSARSNEAKPWMKILGFVGWILIVVGVAGEGVFEGLENHSADTLQTFNDIVLADAERRTTLAAEDAGEAEDSANNAEAASTRANTSANAASDASSNAVVVARSARLEADSFASEIATAKQQAANAVSRLAEAESRLAAAVEQEAKAEAELKQVRTPRSLTDESALITALAPFSGTEFTLNAFMDGESIDFAKEIAVTLKKAGWIRKQPKEIELGIPTALASFGQDPPENLPACLETGIGVHSYAKESRDQLQAIPPGLRPKTIQAGAALYFAIGPTISPPNDKNVAIGFVDPKLAEGQPIVICVGKKP